MGNLHHLRGRMETGTRCPTRASLPSEEHRNVASTMKDPGDFDTRSARAVEDDVTSDGKAAKSRGEFFAKSPHFGGRGEEFTFLLNGIDELIGSRDVFGG